jgi:hypothetical protein
MTPACISEPMSYLRLERYLLDEVGADERRDVDDHLRQCAVCRGCCDSLRGDVSALPELLSVRTLPAQVTPLRRLTPLAAVSGVSALAVAAAALLFLSRPNQAGLATATQPYAGVKGGDLTVSLVRAHRGSTAVDATRFVSGDRFEVRVTCPPGNALRWDVVVLQGGEVFFPLTPSSSLHCGNNITLPGAFTLTGSTPAKVCVATHAHTALDRARLARVLPEMSACAAVSPAK